MAHLTFAFLRPGRSKRQHPPVDRDQVRLAVTRYLGTRPYTLYADWDISRADGLSKATTWLTNQIMNVLQEVNHDE